MTPREKLRELRAQYEFHRKKYEKLRKEWEDNKPSSPVWINLLDASLSQIAEYEKLPESVWKKQNDYMNLLIGENSEVQFHNRKMGELIVEMNELLREINENSLKKD